MRSCRGREWRPRAEAAVRTGSQRERGASARGRLGCERPAPGASRASVELGGEVPGFEGGWGSLPALPARLPRALRSLCVGVKPLLGGGSQGVRPGRSRSREVGVLLFGGLGLGDPWQRWRLSPDIWARASAKAAGGGPPVPPAGRRETQSLGERPLWPGVGAGAGLVPARPVLLGLDSAGRGKTA